MRHRKARLSQQDRQRFFSKSSGGYGVIRYVFSREACFQKSPQIARDQHAKFWELRTATSLARLWGEQGRRAVAREQLTPAYGWFTEGFDTADLKEPEEPLADFA